MDSAEAEFPILDLAFDFYLGKIVFDPFEPSFQNSDSVAAHMIDDDLTTISACCPSRISCSELEEPVLQPLIRTMDLGLTDPQEIIRAFDYDVAVSTNLRIMLSLNACKLEHFNNTEAESVLTFTMNVSFIIHERTIGSIDKLFERVKTRFVVFGRSIHQSEPERFFRNQLEEVRQRHAGVHFKQEIRL